MRVKILGKVWRLLFRPNLKDRGCCDSPHTRDKKILIWSGLEGEEELEVLIHEMLHAAFWKIDEEYILEAARDISKVLWKLKYRKQQ